MADAPEPRDLSPTRPPGARAEDPRATTAEPGAAVAPAEVRADQPRPFGDYELLGEIQRGGMGVVFRAREKSSGRLVALKMMLGESAPGAAELRRFFLEARAAGELQHPGIVSVHAWGVYGGHPFYTMDFVPGVPLNRVLDDGPLPCDRAVRYLVGIARAVAAAHALGIVHRDLKPSNVIIDLGDRPRVLDFGLAKRNVAPPPPKDAKNAEEGAEAPPGAAAGTPWGRSAAPLTQKGAILGTPSYMAPEQVRAQHDRVGPPADVHALGAVLYELLTGRPPFLAESNYETLRRVVDRRPTPIRQLNPRLPATLEAFCDRCLAKDPAERFADAGQLADDLEQRWHQDTQRRRFARLTLAALAAVVLLQVGLALQPQVLNRLGDALAELISGPVGQTTFILFRMARIAILVAAPALAGLGLVAWLGAWVWHAGRARLLRTGSAAVAVAALAAWAAAGAPARWGEALLFLPWLLLAGALTALLVPVVRRWSAPEAEGAPDDDRPEPYLQRLFAARVAAGPGAPASAGDPDSLGDFEPGKLLHRWQGGEVRWGRQQSLDRPVLVWLDKSERAEGAAVPGVVVEHPYVLRLHAVGSGPEGRVLVTEGLAAAPLAEVMEQHDLTPPEVIRLAARLARAVQAFHDQGVCHGRLNPDWVLIHGDLEPALCPCGVPSLAAADRLRDVGALGRLLGEWLPARPTFGQRHYLECVYRVGAAARAGEYARAADLADDLDRAARAADILWEERWADYVILAAFAGVLLALGLILLGSAADLAGYLLAALCPFALLLGFLHGRGFLQRRRLRRRNVRRDRLLPGRLRIDLLQLGLFQAVVMALALAGAIRAPGGETTAGTLLWLAGEMAGFWFLGACGAGLLVFADLLVRSLRRPAD